MAVAAIPRRLTPPDQSEIGTLGFLPLGGSPPLVPEALEIWCAPDADYGGIILLGPVSQVALDNALEGASDPAVPIADFGNNTNLRRDFIGTRFDSDSIKAIRLAFTPIWRRLKELPFAAEEGSRAEIALLRFAYSRDAPFTARFAADSRLLVEYPMLGATASVRGRLEMLAGLDLLRRRHFTRTHSCTKCRSARLHAYEACSECGSANLSAYALIHHYRCGCQEVEPHFKRGDLLVCPKCRQTLRHFGVDYGKPGTAVVCAACGTVNSEPPVRFVCLDCATVTSPDNAPDTDWYHYDLTEEGIRALRQGRLPLFDIAPLLESRTRIYSPREFRLLAMHELKVSERFKRPFSVARITVLNLDSLMREHGAMATDDGFRHVADAIAARLRASDFVGVGGRLSAVIGFPGTSAKDFHVIEKRIHDSVATHATIRMELGIEVAEGDSIVDFLSED